MKKLVLAGIFLVLVVPVVIVQLSGSDPRSLEAVELEGTTYEEVRFRNETQDLDLAGLLFVPEGEDPFPAAVIIQGSGSSHRNSGWYLTLAQYLRDNGVLVLLPDKRGSEQSGGDWRSASFEDLATDTAAAVDYLHDQEQIAVSYVGVIGMSQGGHIAPVVADQTQEIDFLVNMVGGAVSMHELLVYEENHNLRELGVLPGISDALAYPAAWSIIYLRQSDFWNAIGNFDPIPYWEGLSVDSLVLYGEGDTNVPSEKSAALLRSLGNPNIDVKIYEGSGHALESPVGVGNQIIRPDALEDIRNFIASSSP